MTDYYLYIAIFVVCLLLSMFFSASEAALAAIPRGRVRTLVQEGRKGAEALSVLKEHPDRGLITLLSGNTFVNVVAVAVATVMAVSVMGNLGLLVTIIIVTLVLLLLCEIAPRVYASSGHEDFALSVAPVILGLSKLCTPMIWVVERTGKPGPLQDIGAPVVTEDEIREWIDVGKQGGSIEEEEKEMLYSVLEFGDTTAREIMTPRIDVAMMEDTHTVDSALRLFNETGFSRIPVFHDNVDNIIGVLNIKDVFSVFVSGKKNLPIKEIMYDPFFVPETKKIDDLLKELQVRKVQIAIVLDEYSSFAGIVTVEDILEELVGDILDEFDQEEPDIQKAGEGIFLVDAQVWVEDLNDELDLNLPVHESYETIGGLLIDRLGHIPHPGESVEIPEVNLTLVVVQMRGRRIVKIKIIITPNQGSTASGGGKPA